MSTHAQRLVAVALLAFLVTIAVSLALRVAVTLAAGGSLDGCC